MKAIKYISFGLLSVFALSACSDKFLEDKKNYDNAIITISVVVMAVSMIFMAGVCLP